MEKPSKFGIKEYAKVHGHKMVKCPKCGKQAAETSGLGVARSYYHEVELKQSYLGPFVDIIKSCLVVQPGRITELRVKLKTQKVVEMYGVKYTAERFAKLEQSYAS